jgi:hypothetical protein
MSDLTFPIDPSIGDTTVTSGREWVWDGQAWVSNNPPFVVGPTGATGPRGATGLLGPRGLRGPDGPALPVADYQTGKVLATDGVFGSPALYWADEFTNFTLTGSTLVNYTEQYYLMAGGVSLIEIDLSNGTIQRMVLETPNPTISMPTLVAGKTFTLILAQPAAGGIPVAWSGVVWAGGVTPTMTSTGNRSDIFRFFSDGARWYGIVVGQNYTTA